MISEYIRTNLYSKTKKINLFDNLLFNASLMNKKENLKVELYAFVRELYIYMTFKIISEEEKSNIKKYIDPYQGCNKHDLPTKGITEKDLHRLEISLYLKYIDLINKTLSRNKEEVNLTLLRYFLNVQLDMLETSKKHPEVSFIYLNDIKHINKLKEILKEIYKYSEDDDYFLFPEFQDFLINFRENLYIENIDIFRELNKIPKHLKRRNYVNKR